MHLYTCVYMYACPVGSVYLYTGCTPVLSFIPKSPSIAINLWRELKHDYIKHMYPRILCRATDENGKR